MSRRPNGVSPPAPPTARERERTRALRVFAHRPDVWLCAKTVIGLVRPRARTVESAGTSAEAAWRRSAGKTLQMGAPTSRKRCATSARCAGTLPCLLLAHLRALPCQKCKKYLICDSEPSGPNNTTPWLSDVVHTHHTGISYHRAPQIHSKLHHRGS